MPCSVIYAHTQSHPYFMLVHRAGRETERGQQKDTFAGAEEKNVREERKWNGEISESTYANTVKT